MPIEFDTLSHGLIPIGFFNIESDMFLINDHFIFASDLCKALTDWTIGPDDQAVELEMYVISSPAGIGNLMGAIRGEVFTGFIGELYKRYPFPQAREDFKQNPEGYKTREEVEEIIKSFGTVETIKIVITQDEGTISIGEYNFNKEQFHEVIAYIWRGGMPMWKNDQRPDYVNEMMKSVLSSDHWLFKMSEDK
jgi:hypothetical protein